MTPKEAIAKLNDRHMTVSMCISADECREENEALDMAKDALEKQEQYRWHDLRKNPEDLPKEMPVIVHYDNTHYGAKYKGVALAETMWRDCFGQCIGNVIAWRYIEPF